MSKYKYNHSNGNDETIFQEEIEEPSEEFKTWMRTLLKNIGEGKTEEARKMFWSDDFIDEGFKKDDD